MIIVEMVIACFPDLFPDETWQSACSRFVRRMRYPIVTTYLRKLQDSDNRFISPDFPSKIDHVTTRITSGVTSRDVIHNHTLYPLHAPFLTVKQRQLLISAMCGGGNPIRLLGLVNFAAQQPRHLRFCPKCMESDSSLYGEAYWHRVHQVGFSRFCPHHNCSLVESTIAFRPYVFETGLPICDQALGKDLGNKIIVDETNSPIWQKLARDVYWLLESNNQYTDPSENRIRYIKLLKDQSLATKSGRVKIPALLEAFHGYYYGFPLDLIGCKVIDPRQNWILDTIRNGSQSPIHNLLLMQFLGVTLEKFFLIDSSQPFGNGPWVCLNPTISHFNQLTIHNVQLSATRDGRPIGVFACACGYTYKVVPRKDKSLTDLFRVVKYGAAWCDVFTKAWQDNSITMTELMNRFGLDHGTLRHQAVRLKLPITRHNARTQNPKIRLGRGAAKRYRPKRQVNLLETRQSFLAAKAEQPQQSRTELREQQKKNVSRLRRYDQEWLSQNQPSIENKPVVRENRIDWVERDQNLAIKVIPTILQIQQIEPPRRASISAIIRFMQAKTITSIPQSLLPSTWKTLRANAETAKAFLSRLRKSNF
jgi:hypothetical protein